MISFITLKRVSSNGAPLLLSSVIERIFGIPGIGLLMISGIQQNDYNVTLACSFIYSVMYIVVMLVVDILYGIIDPRIRVSKEG